MSTRRAELFKTACLLPEDLFDYADLNSHHLFRLKKKVISEATSLSKQTAVMANQKIILSQLHSRAFQREMLCTVKSDNKMLYHQQQVLECNLKLY